MPRTNVPLDDIVVRKQLPLGQNKHQHQMKFSEIDYLFEGVGYRVYLIYAFRSNFLNEMECKEFHRERGLFILPWVVPESISPTKGICTPCRAYEINYSWPFCWSVGYRMAWESDSAFLLWGMSWSAKRQHTLCSQHGEFRLVIRIKSLWDVVWYLNLSENVSGIQNSALAS